MVSGRGGVGFIERQRLKLVWRPSDRRGPAGALLAAIEAQRAGIVFLPFDANGVMPYVMDFANKTEEAARLFALDALDLTRPDLIETLPLAVEERQLLYAWYEVRSGVDGPHTIDRVLCALSFAPELGLKMLAALWRHVDSRREAVLEALRTCGDDDLVATTLLAELDSGEFDVTLTARAMRQLVGPVSRNPSLADLNSLDQLLGSRSGRDGEQGLPASLKGTRGHAEWLALDALDGHHISEISSIETGDLARIPNPVLEDLIERAALRPEQLAHPDLRDLCRVHADPLLVPASRLLDLGQPDLLGWIAVVTKDPSLVDGVEAESLRRGRALAHLAVGDLNLRDEDLAALEPGEADLVESLLVCLRSGSWADATSRLLEDESVGPLLASLEPPAQVPKARSTLVATAHLRAAKRFVHEWNWAEAEVAARAALASAPQERQRDEALNLLAASQWQRGDPTKALAAIDKALEGAYTDALLINAGVVASELDPSIAVDHFARLATEAPSTEERARAAERSVMFWSIDGDPWDDAGPPMPTALRHAIRELVARDDLELARWRDLVALLAVRDEEWLASAPLHALGVRGSSAAGRVLRGRAAGVYEWIGEMSRALRGQLDEDTRAWLVDERDRLVQAVIEEMLSDEPNLGAAGIALEIVDQNLPVDDEDGIALRALACWVASDQIDTDTQEPSEALINRTEEAARSLPGLPAERRGLLQPLVDTAGDAVARSLLIARAKEFDGLIDDYNSMLDELRAMERWKVDRKAVFGILDTYESYFTETGTLLKRAADLAKDGELSQAIGSFAGNVRDALVSVRTTRSEL